MWAASGRRLVAFVGKVRMCWVRALVRRNSKQAEGWIDARSLTESVNLISAPQRLARRRQLNTPGNNVREDGLWEEGDEFLPSCCTSCSHYRGPLTGKVHMPAGVPAGCHGAVIVPLDKKHTKPLLGPTPSSNAHPSTSPPARTASILQSAFPALLSSKETGWMTQAKHVT